MADENNKANWLKPETILSLISTAVVIIGGAVGYVIYISDNAHKTDSTAAAMITVNARLDRIFEKLDVLPVLVEKVRQAEVQITDGKGSYSSLDLRLRVIENNAAVARSDIDTTRTRSPLPR